MTDLRTAARQALEALEVATTPLTKDRQEVLAAVTALREALAQPQTADDLMEPTNGAKWRVEWWNESCRMMLPENQQLSHFEAYKNGTLRFTIKRRPQ